MLKSRTIEYVLIREEACFATFNPVHSLLNQAEICKHYKTMDFMLCVTLYWS